MSAETHSGTVFDIGYRNYTGVREGTDRSRRAVFKDGVRTALGIGRGGKAKVLPWFFITVLAMIGLIMALVAGAAERLAGPGAAERLNLPSHSDYYGIAVMIMFVFAAIVAPELLCRDKREGVMNLYLVRPLTGSDYIISRWSAFFAVMLVTSWVPQFLLFMGLSMGAPVPMDYLKLHWMDVPRFMTAGFIMSAYITTIALLTASFTNRRAYAAVFLVGLFIISTPFTIGLAQELDGSAGQWVSMFNLTNIPLHVADIIFDDTAELTREAPARTLGPTVLVLWYTAWTLIPAGILWSRYRRLTP
jgi:ABC-2 type transport system permease protein